MGRGDIDMDQFIFDLIRFAGELVFIALAIVVLGAITVAGIKAHYRGN